MNWGSKMLRAAPLLLTAFMLFWTWAVAPYSKYGDNWAVYPVVVAFVLVIFWHLGLIFTQERKGVFILYAIVHVLLLFPVWIYCLMKISKDSL